jgi:hypothetical protein
MVCREIGMARNIRFPAVAISRHNSFSVVTEIETSCNALGWRKGYFEDLSYVDASGTLWPVIRANPSRRITFFDRLLNRRLDVSLEFGEPQIDAVELAKELIYELIDRDADDLYSQFVSHSDLKELIKKAKSAEELITVAERLGAT